MALVTCYDPDGSPHQKEPIDAREACLHNGFTMAPPGEAAVVEHVPTKGELLAARDQLLEREHALDERAQRLADAEERVAEQARANEGEAQRLSAELVTIQAERSAAVAAAAAAAASVTTSTEKPAKATKA